MSVQDDSIFFENHWKPEREHLASAFRELFARLGGASQPVRWLLIAALAMIGAGLYVFGYGRYGWLPLALSALLTAMQVFLPGKNAQILIGQWEARNASLSAPYTVFYDSHFCFFDLASRHEEEALYDWVTHGMETDRMLILLLKSKKPVFLDKAGFVKGEEQAFREFVEGKAPKARFSWKKH